MFDVIVMTDAIVMFTVNPAKAGASADGTSIEMGRVQCGGWGRFQTCPYLSVSRVIWFFAGEKQCQINGQTSS